MFAKFACQIYFGTVLEQYKTEKSRMNHILNVNHDGRDEHYLLPYRVRIISAIK